jgi:Icc-related predicted phosphoesterase
MIFIYTTDLHGDQKKYNNILSYALDHKINLIHLGADILPKGKNLFDIQQTFLQKFLRNFYKTAKDYGITILTSFGNDDLFSLKKEFRKFASLLDEQPVEIEGYLFKSYPWVCDYPFALKSACKLDYRGWMRPFCLWGVDYLENGLRVEIENENIDKYFKKKTTIQEDLENEIILHNKVIWSCHMPPRELELDVCGRRTKDGYDRFERVGSVSIYNWIKKQQPMITLHGHIHENYDITKRWKVLLGNTLVIQPGQPFVTIYDKEEKTRFVVIEIKDTIESTLVEI